MIFPMRTNVTLIQNLFFVLLFLISSSCFSQDVLMNDVEWGEGSIILNDQTELKGQINYNDKKGIISYESGRESKVFNARQLLGFEFYDHRVDRKRLFYSLEYEDTKTTNNGPYIFELMKELKGFAILSKIDPVDVKVKNAYSIPYASPVGPAYSNPVGSRTHVKITQSETIYLFPAEGKVTPLLEMNFRMTEGKMIDGKRTRSKMVNKELLIKCLGDSYPDLEKYAREKGLDFEDKDDLMKIFDYYEASVGGQ